MAAWSKLDRRNFLSLRCDSDLINLSHNSVTHLHSAKASRLSRDGPVRLQQWWSYVVRVGKPPRGFISAHKMLFVAAFAFSGACLAACNFVTLNDTESYPPDVFDRIRSVDLLPHSPASQEASGGARDRRQSAVYTGEAVTALAASNVSGTAKSPEGGEGYELNFENTPVTNVAKVVLGDILGVGYTIDPRVQGTISLASGRPVPKADILFVLENALRVSNVVLVRGDRRLSRSSPLGDAIGSGNLDSDRRERRSRATAFRWSPCNTFRRQTLIKLLDSFATKPGTMRADAARNMLAHPRQRAPSAVPRSKPSSASMRTGCSGQSVGIFPVRNSTPEPIIAELEKIVDSGEGGLGQNRRSNSSRLARMNSILVVARKPTAAENRGDLDQAARQRRQYGEHKRTGCIGFATARPARWQSVSQRYISRERIAEAVLENRRSIKSLPARALSQRRAATNMGSVRAMLGTRFRNVIARQQPCAAAARRARLPISAQPTAERQHLPGPAPCASARRDGRGQRRTDAIRRADNTPTSSTTALLIYAEPGELSNHRTGAPADRPSAVQVAIDATIARSRSTTI